MGGSSSHEALRDKTVVVVGCSFGGKAVAYPLRGKCNLIVIDPREAMHLTIASPRAVIEPGFAKKTLIPLKDVFGDSFKQGTVDDINPAGNKVILAGGESISYDYLVIATGSSNPFPGKLENDTSLAQALELYKNACQQVRAAQKVVVIGGGAVGVELAAEVATDFPEKEVTLVHSRDTLVEPATSLGFRKAVQKQLEQLKVHLVLGEKVTNLASIPSDLSGGATVVTDGGKSLSADLVFISIGAKVNSQAYARSLASCMDERGALMVNAFLQVKGHDNIFAVGDCCDGDVQKMAYRAGEQGKAAYTNIVLHCEKKSLKRYKAPGILFAVSLGRHRGQIQLGGMTFGSWFVKRVKSGDMFTGKMWKEWGLRVPQE